MVYRDISFTFLSVCLSLGHAFNKINKVWQQISLRHVVRKGTKFGRLIEAALLYISAGLVNFGPGGPLWRQNTEACTHFL